MVAEACMVRDCARAGEVSGVEDARRLLLVLVLVRWASLVRLVLLLESSS